MQLSRSSLAAAVVSIATFSLAACSDSTTAPIEKSARTAPPASVAANRHEDDDDKNGSGAVYTLTNAVAGNGVIAFHRAPNGALTPLGTFATGGRGTGGAVDPLTSQYSVVLSDDHDALFAVDAGSNQVSSFRVKNDGSLIRVGTLPSGGQRPISLAVSRTLLYVLNTDDNTLSGFLRIGPILIPLPYTKHALAAGANGAAAVRFTHDGRYLIVTERVSNRLEVFPVLITGALGAPTVSAASGSATFGFDVTSHNQPIVSETQGSVTSYALGHNGALTPITASIATGGAATCWVIITEDGRFAYATNAGSNFVSGFAISNDGHLTALTPGVATGDAGAGASPIDLDQVGSRFLYTLEAGRGTIGTFAIGNGGGLTARPDTPAGAGSSGLQGLAAY
jgi:6-phosphogluconolactonase